MPDEGKESAQISVDIFKIIILTGAVVGIISVFLLWYAKEYYSLFELNYTGFDFFTKSHGHPDEGYFIYMPLAVLVASALAFISSVLSFIVHDKKVAAAAAALGAVILTAALLYATYPESMMWLCNADGEYNLIHEIRLMDNPGVGIYCAMAAGLFLIVGGAGALLRGRKKQGAQQDGARQEE